jgi:hypothetical protein
LGTTALRLRYFGSYLVPVDVMLRMLTVLHVGRMRGSAIEYRYYNPIPCLGMTTRYWMTQTRVRETALRLRVRLGNRRDQMCIDSEHRRMHLGFSFNDGDVFL